MNTIISYSDIKINLPKKPNDYLEQVVNFLSIYFPGEIESLILFGSYARGMGTEISDVDIIIIVIDSVNKTRIQRAAQHLTWLELQYQLIVPSTSLLDQINTVFDRQSGMFVSHFLCSRADFISNNFSKIFNTSRFFTYFLAPNQFVFTNIRATGKIIWGKDLFPLMKPITINNNQLLKSYVLNSLQVLKSYVFNFHKSTKHMLESIKWSLFNCYTYKTGHSSNLNELVKYFENQLMIGPFLRKQLRKFLSLRSKYKNDALFSFYAIFIVFLIHKTTIDSMK